MNKYTQDKNKIQNFIEKILYRKLKKDQKNLKILSEGDLQSCVYHHLRKFFDRNDFSNLYISNKLSMGKLKEVKKFPDIAILYMREKSKVYPIFLIELKENTKFNPKSVSSDVKKLNGLIKKNKKNLEQTYFIYAINDDRHTTKEFDEIIRISDPKSQGWNFPMIINFYGEKHRPTELEIYKNKLAKLRRFRYN